MAPFVLGLVLGRDTFGNSVPLVILSVAWAMCIAAYGLFINFKFPGFRCPQCSERFGRGAE